jgi:hypothetical protein
MPRPARRWAMGEELKRRVLENTLRYRRRLDELDEKIRRARSMTKDDAKIVGEHNRIQHALNELERNNQSATKWLNMSKAERHSWIKNYQPE